MPPAGRGFPPIHRLDRETPPRSSWSPSTTWPMAAEKRGLGQKYQAVLVDMEAAAVARFRSQPRGSPFTASRRFRMRRARYCLTSAGTPTARVSCSWRRCWLTSRSGPGTGRPWPAWGRMAGRARWRWPRSWVLWSVGLSWMIWNLRLGESRRLSVGYPTSRSFSRDVGYHEP